MSKLLRRLWPACALAILLGGCAAAPAPEEPGVALWFAGVTDVWSSDVKAVDAVPFQGGEATVDSLMAALLSGPEPEHALRSPIPENTRLLGWQLDEDGLLRVDLSGEYGSLAGMELTLADYCIALTLEQLEGVERVTVTVNGRTLSYRYRQELSGDQVIFSGVEEQPVERSAFLYFPRTAGRGLSFEQRAFQLTEGDILAEVVTQALIDGPQGDGLSSVIPEGVQLQSVRLEEGVCTVSFSDAFLTGMPESEDRQTLVVYAVINTLGNLDAADSVTIQVDGETLERYGAVALPGPMEPDFGLVDED